MYYAGQPKIRPFVNKTGYVRDVAFAEHASRIRKNPGVVARLRSFTDNLFRASG